MSAYPDGYEVPLRSGAAPSADPESRIGPHNRFWHDADDIRNAVRAYRQIQDECRPREPKRRERKAER